MERKWRAPHHVRTMGVIFSILGWLAACSSDATPRVQPSVLDDDSITIASFDFAESEVLALVYGQALQAHGFTVDVRRSVGPREVLLPALMKGLVEIIPEYAGTSLAFMSLGKVQPSSDPMTTHDAIAQVLAADGRAVALAPSPAQNANVVVVTPETAEEYDLRTISDLGDVADGLTFGGPPECPSRPFCLLGLESIYGLTFEEFLPLDAGGPVTRDALTASHVDVGLLFTTDPSIGSGGFIALDDDLGLQQAENVTPLVHAAVVDRWGRGLTDVLDDVSARLTTDELRSLNGSVAAGASPADAAADWLASEGLT